MKDSRPDGAIARLALILGLVASAGGCSMMRPTETGFLTHYEDLSPTTARINWGIGTYHARVQLPKADDLARIDSFYIEPVAWLARETDWLGDSADRRDRVTAALDRGLRARLGKIRPIVAEPGPATARVRAAVTDLKSARPVVNAIATVVWGPITNGGAAVEAEVVAPDGHRIAAVDGGSDGGMLDIFGYYTRSGHPKRNATRLANELGDAVEGRQVGRLRPNKAYFPEPASAR